MLTPSGRRRADRLAALLEDTAARRADVDLVPLVRLADRLRATGTAVADPAAVHPVFRDRLRTRLVAVGTVHGIGTEASGSTRADGPDLDRTGARTDRGRRRAVLATAALVGVVGMTAMGAASDSAVPGDPLYGVKRSTETAQLELARSDVSKGQLHLEFARTRLAEARTVAADPEKLDATLGAMDTETKDALRLLGTAALERQDRGPLDALDDTVRVQRDGLTRLLVSLPLTGTARSRAVASLNLLERVQDRSRLLRQNLLCTNGYVDEPLSDELGPLPQRCAASPTSPTSNSSSSDPVLQVPGTSTPPSGTVPGTTAVPDEAAPGGGTPGSGGAPGADPPGAGTPGGVAPPTGTSTGAGALLGELSEVVGGIANGLPEGGTPEPTVTPSGMATSTISPSPSLPVTPPADVRSPLPATPTPDPTTAPVPAPPISTPTLPVPVPTP